MQQEPALTPPPLPSRDAASSILAQHRALGDVGNASPSPLAARDPNGARRRGRKLRQQTFKNFSGLPTRAKSTRRRSALIPDDHAAAPSARPAVAASQPTAALVQVVAAPAALTSSRSAPPKRGELPVRPAPWPSTAPISMATTVYEMTQIHGFLYIISEFLSQQVDGLY